MTIDIPIYLVVAMAQNGVIGCDNQLPWRLPKDLAYFKRVTMGHPIVMGRKTFESIGKPLPGRQNIVLTRQADWSVEGVEVCSSVSQLIDKYAGGVEVGPIMVIGGAEIYQAFLPYAKRLYITEVYAEVQGDAYFPSVDMGAWEKSSIERHTADNQNPYDYAFVVYEKMT